MWSLKLLSLINNWPQLSAGHFILSTTVRNGHCWLYCALSSMKELLSRNCTVHSTGNIFPLSPSGTGGSSLLVSLFWAIDTMYFPGFCFASWNMFPALLPFSFAVDPNVDFSFESSSCFFLTSWKYVPAAEMLQRQGKRVLIWVVFVLLSPSGGFTVESACSICLFESSVFCSSHPLWFDRSVYLVCFCCGFICHCNCYHFFFRFIFTDIYDSNLLTWLKMLFPS